MTAKEIRDSFKQFFESKQHAIVPSAPMVIKDDPTLMITHNMRDAIRHGNRLIMMHEGRVVVDVSGEEKSRLTVEDLLQLFNRASGSEFSSDRAIQIGRAHV